MSNSRTFGHHALAHNRYLPPSRETELRRLHSTEDLHRGSNARLPPKIRRTGPPGPKGEDGPNSRIHVRANVGTDGRLANARASSQPDNAPWLSTAFAARPRRRPTREPALSDRLTERQMKRLEWFFHIIRLRDFNAAVSCRFFFAQATIWRSGRAPTRSIPIATAIRPSGDASSLLLRNARAAFQYLPRMWPIIALLLLAVVSISWSDYPDITLRRSVSLATATPMGLVRDRAIRPEGRHRDHPAGDRA